MQKDGDQGITNFMRDPRRQPAEQGKVLHALRLAFQALALGHCVPEGRRPSGDLLLQRYIEVVQRLVPRVQLGQERGLLSEMPLLRRVQLLQCMLAAPGHKRTKKMQRTRAGVHHVL